MSTTIHYAKSILLAFTFCFASLAICGSVGVAQEIQWRQSLDEAKAEAIETNRLVWLHFAADWCAPCKKLDTFVFSNPTVIRTSDRNVVAVKIDVDENDLLVRKLGVPRVPYDIVMTPEGETIINRPSPKAGTDYLKMFESLDGPLQALNAGDRVSINAGINQVQKVVDKVGGFRQNKSDLDLEGPSHQMAATTVEGQRIERGLDSTERAAEIRALEAKLLKQKAKLFIAQEEQRLSAAKGPKVSENPFFGGANANASSANDGIGNVGKVVSNQFVVKQEEPTDIDSAIVDESVEQIGNDIAERLRLYNESQEFSFPSLTGGSVDDVSKEADQKTDKAVGPTLTLPKISASRLAELKQLHPKLPEFKGPSGDKADINGFAYAPIDELKMALKATTKPNGQAKTDKQVVEEANESSLRSASGDKTLTSELPMAVAKRPAKPVVKPRYVTHTDVAVPRPPVMVEGVVKIAKSMAPSVEGRLIAAEQPIENNFRVGRQRASAGRPQQIQQSDQLLDQVNFFGVEKPVAQPPQVTIVQAQPVPQPQVVINLNAGAAAQPVAGSQGRITQPSVVPQAAATTNAGNRARIVSNDIASAVRSKYALKGKCPVTLLTQGRWAEGKKEIGCVHRDRVYLFASAENREAFLANPDQLSPLLAGFDPVIFEETGKLIEGEERFGTFMGDAPNQRIVLFKTADTRGRFQKDPIKYINVVRNAMAKKARKDIKLR